MIKRVSQRSPKASGFGQDFLSSRLTEGQNQFLMLKRCEKGQVILIIDDDDRQRGAQQLQDAAPSFGIELLVADP